ncbi:hypothetical protein VPHF86_0097 [Vibrio phage F86]
MNYIQISDILSDDTLAFSLAGAPRIDTLPEDERNNVLNKAVEISLYERMPSTAVLDFLIASGIDFIGILSDVEAIAMQQSVWLEAISKHNKIDIKYTAMSDVEFGRDSLTSESNLLICADRKELTRHALGGGRMLPFSTETQFEFIIEQLTNAQAGDYATPDAK